MPNNIKSGSLNNINSGDVIAVVVLVTVFVVTIDSCSRTKGVGMRYCGNCSDCRCCRIFGWQPNRGITHPCTKATSTTTMMTAIVTMTRVMATLLLQLHQSTIHNKRSYVRNNKERSFGYFNYRSLPKRQFVTSSRGRPTRIVLWLFKISTDCALRADSVATTLSCRLVLATK